MTLSMLQRFFGYLQIERQKHAFFLPVHSRYNLPISENGGYSFYFYCTKEPELANSQSNDKAECMPTPAQEPDPAN